MMADDEFSDLIQIPADVVEQVVGFRMFALNLLENFRRRFVGIDFFCRFGERSLFLF